jgi:hypothetical protein
LAAEDRIVEPVRVKVYGLFSRTRRRYLIEAATGAVFGLLLFAAWWLGWPHLRQRLVNLDLPPLLRLIVAVLDRTPWILLGAALWKGMEVLLVLRAFAHKEARIQLTNSSNQT